MPRAIRFDRYGDRDVYYVAEVERPDPGPGQVVVEVKAAAVNPGETMIRSGALHDRLPASFPSGQGSDLAGVVAAVGAGVEAFAVGDEVLGYSWERSSHADLCVVPAGQLVPKPAGLSWEVAGSLYVAGCAAWAGVEAVAAAAGDTVVVSAAAGGVGSIAVQLLVARGATSVGIASEANHAWLASRGVTPVSYGDGLAERLGQMGPDAMIDCFGEAYVRLAVDLGIAKDRIDTIIAFAAAAELGVKAEGSGAVSAPEVLTALADMVVAGLVEVPVAATYPLERVADAFAELEQRHTRGKIVLIP